MTRRLAAFLLLFVTIFGVLGGSTPGASASPLTVSSQEATPDFPDVIDFELQAKSEQNIERVELLYSLAGDEKRHLARPDFTPATEIDLEYNLDMSARGIPPGAIFTYLWKFVALDGTTFESDSESFVWNDDRFSWAELSSDQVAVHAYNSDEQFNRQILDSAQSTVDKLESDFGLSQIDPVNIWIYNSVKDYEGAKLTNSETWSAAITFPELSLVLAAIPDGDDSEVGRIVPHEITHQVLYQATRNPYNSPPTWLNEGLAVFNQENGNEDMPAIVRNAAATGSLMSLQSLNSSFPYDPDEADLAYAESFSVVTFIIDHFGAEKMGDLIEAYRSGLSHDEAAKSALGVDVDELDQLWRESL